MAAHKGHKKVGGRQKGTANKITTDTKTIISFVVNKHSGKADAALQQVLDDDPARFLEIWVKMAEYCLPKLARQVDKNGDDVAPASITVTFTNGDNHTTSI